MKTIRNFSEVEKILAIYRPAAKEFTGKDITLRRMQPLMTKIGNPEKDLRIIHIAGTSGKSSTAYYLAELLKLTGQKVGLTISPHVDSIAERVQINGKPLTEAKFCALFNEFIEIISDVEPQPSYYELLIAFAYWVFKKEKVDWAVVETGLGGLQDGTNVADNPDKVCVITDIGFDHMHILGNTLPEIAAQKAGIIHRSNTALMFAQSPEINRVIEKWCSGNEAKLMMLSEETARRQAKIDLTGLPTFQQRNWLLAYWVFDYVRQRANLPKLSNKNLQNSLKTTIAGRMEIVNWRGKTLVMDGAHNPQKMAEFIKSFKHKFPGARPAVLLSVRTKKDFKALVDQLMEIASCLVLTRFFVTQDITHVSTALEPIIRHCQQKGFGNVFIEHNHRKALNLLENQNTQICVITGSFYLLNHIRPLLKHDSLEA